jgi:membrane fusion protein (multidrug efflux system)
MMYRIVQCALLCLLAAGCDKEATKPPTAVAIPVTTAKAKTGEFPVKRTYPAIASPVWEIDIIARVEGWLEDRHVRQGSIVEKGELLFTLQKLPFEADVLSATAALRQAEAQELLAQVNYDRNAPLVASGAIAAETLDQYKANLAVAKAEVLAAEAQIIQAELNLSYTEIRAPIHGRIGATSIDPGTLLIPGTSNATLCTLIMVDPIRINFAPSANEFPEYLAKWTEDTPLHAEVVIPRLTTWKRDGTITFVDNAANPNTSLIRMWTDVDNSGHDLLPGQYCEATVTMRVLKDVVTIPSTALVQVASEQYVWLVGSDSKVTENKVVVNFQQDGTAVLVSGLKAGDQIVVQGMSKIRTNGTLITEAKPPTSPGTPPPSLKSSEKKKND